MVSAAVSSGIPIPKKSIRECLAKASVLTYSKPPGNFDLFETMLWTPEVGYFLLDEHLERLYTSAEYFTFRAIKLL